MVNNMKKKKQTLKGEYVRCWEFLKESRNYVYASVITFFLFFLIGFAFPVFYRTEIIDILYGMVLKFDGLNFYDGIILIFGNNSLVALLAILGGFIFGLLPLWYLVSNGYLVGFVSTEVVALRGLSELWRLLPHGIFELPAVLICMGLGLRIGFELFDKKRSVKKTFIESMRFYIFVVIPLLFLAAVIEGVLIFSGV